MYFLYETDEALINYYSFNMKKYCNISWRVILFEISKEKEEKSYINYIGAMYVLIS